MRSLCVLLFITTAVLAMDTSKDVVLNQTSECVDLTINQTTWYNENMTSTCAWYQENDNCFQYGEYYGSFNTVWETITANQACCVCGGGNEDYNEEGSSSDYFEVEPTCADGKQNGNETGIDCGGSTCEPCPPSCTDGTQNGNETSIDCGGPTCEPCPPTCTDGIQNGDEGGVDCGGSMCEGCPQKCYEYMCEQITNFMEHEQDALFVKRAGNEYHNCATDQCTNDECCEITTCSNHPTFTCSSGTSTENSNLQLKYDSIICPHGECNIDLCCYEPQKWIGITGKTVDQTCNDGSTRIGSYVDVDIDQCRYQCYQETLDGYKCQYIVFTEDANDGNICFTCRDIPQDPSHYNCASDNTTCTVEQLTGKKCSGGMVTSHNEHFTFYDLAHVTQELFQCSDEEHQITVECVDGDMTVEGECSPQIEVFIKQQGADYRFRDDVVLDARYVHNVDECKILCEMNDDCTHFEVKTPFPISEVLYGCTDYTAENYNPSATVDDGSCTYPKKRMLFGPNQFGPEIEPQSKSLVCNLAGLAQDIDFLSLFDMIYTCDTQNYACESWEIIREQISDTCSTDADCESSHYCNGRYCLTRSEQHQICSESGHPYPKCDEENNEFCIEGFMHGKTGNKLQIHPEQRNVCTYISNEDVWAQAENECKPKERENYHWCDSMKKCVAPHESCTTIIHNNEDGQVNKYLLTMLPFVLLGMARVNFDL